MFTSFLGNVARSAFRRVIEVDPNVDREVIMARIESAQVVSFDIFDTLIKRNVCYPHEVLSAVARVAEKRGFEVPPTFEEIRRTAERRAYENAPGEISLKDIYSEIACDPKTREVLRNIEIECEEKLAVANNPMREVFNRAIAMGKRVVLTSDMYLPRECVETILDKQGFRGYEALFLSSEVGVQKKSGELYKLLSKRLGVDSRGILHIGDNIQADYLKARQNKIEALLIPRLSYRSRHELSWNMFGDSLTCSIMAALSKNLAVGKGYYYKFGVEALGPLLVGLVDFIYDDMKKRGLNQIYFLSRDGSIVKRAFDLLVNDENLQSRYLYASRRASCLPSVYGRGDLIEVAPTTRQIKVADFLAAIGVMGTQAEMIAAEAGYKSDDRVTKLDSLEDPNFIGLIDLALPVVLDTASKERLALVQYLEGQELGDKAAVFDLGWAGNTQGCLNRVLVKELGRPKLYGYYLGVDKAKVRNDIDYSSFLGFNYPSMYLQMVELCFSSQEGTVQKFDFNSLGEAVPVLAEYEYADRREMTAVVDIQRGAIDYVTSIGTYRDMLELKGSPNAFFSSMRSYGECPSYEDACNFGDFMFSDGRIYEALAESVGIGYAVKEPKKTKLKFEKSMWKVGFAKRLLRVPLPYYGLLRFLKERYVIGGKCN